MEILKQCGLPRPRIGGMEAASASNLPSTESGECLFLRLFPKLLGILLFLHNFQYTTEFIGQPSIHTGE
jgi:hypothetical protein